MLRAHRLLAGGLLGLLAAGLAPGVASAANPTVIEFSKNPAQAVHGNSTFGTVASFPVGPGRWLVIAKAELTFPEKNDPHQTTSCTLFMTNGDGWQGYVSVSQPNASTTTAGVPTPAGEGFSVSVADRLNTAGHVYLRCQTNAGTNHVWIRQIHITAIKVGKLSIVHSGSNTPTVYGTGKPEAVWVWNTNTSPIPSGGSVTGSQISVPAGTWMAVASSSIYSTGSGATGYCNFADLADVSRAQWRTVSAGLPGDQQALTAQVEFHTTFPTALYWQCHSNTGPATIFNTFFAMVRLTRWAQENVGSTQIFGSGSPSAYSTANSADQDIAPTHPANLSRSLRLPAGSYIVGATVQVTEKLVKAELVHCTLKVGSKSLDQADTRVANLLGYVETQRLVLIGSVKLAAVSHVGLSCWQTGTTSEVKASNLHITALQAAITIKP